MTYKKVKVLISQKKQKFFLYTGFLLLWSLAIAIMPVASAVKEKTRLLLYFSGAAFWLGAVGTVYMALQICLSRKDSRHIDVKSIRLKKLGVLNFFQNKAARIADIVMFISIIGFVIIRCTDVTTVSFIFFAVFIFSFGMHCMLNGINYKYMNNEVRRDKGL